MKKETRGRKPLFKETYVMSIRLDDSMYKSIPDPKPDFIRQAINEKLRRTQECMDMKK